MLLDNKRIFVIEDDETNLAIISTTLRRNGAKVFFDTWGGGTVDALKRFQPIDLILLDLALPRGLSGYDVFDRIREIPELKDIPVVLVTAADPGMEMNKARQKGVDGYIPKPINYYTFGQLISDILQGKQVWGEE